MPELDAGQLTTWRTRHGALYYAYVSRPEIIFAARVNMADISYPLNEITFDTVTTGAYTDIKSGFTLLLGSTAGASDYGRQRVRGNATSTTILVGRSSRGTNDGELRVVDNAFISILKERRVWAKIPRIDGATLYKDERSYTDARADKGVANAGPDFADFVDTTTGLITVDFTAAGSYKLNQTITDYLWDLDGGTVTSGTLTAATLTATFPEGEYDVSLTVTFSDGSEMTTYRWIVAATKTGTYAATRCELGQRRKTPDGTTVSLTLVSGSLPHTTNPTGTRVIVWARETYGSTVGSLAGATGREHVKFTGWIGDEPTDLRANQNRVTLNCIGLGERLRQIVGFPFALHRKTAATRWNHATSDQANLQGFIEYTLRHHTTALELADFYPAPHGPAFTYSLLRIDKMSPWEQTSKMAKAMGSVLTCDAQGRLAVKAHPLYFPTASQAATQSLPYERTDTVIVPLQPNDFRSLRRSDGLPPRLHWVNGSALLVSTQGGEASNRQDTALFCIAPGKSPGQGLEAPDSGEQLALSQDWLNALEGNRYRANNATESAYQFELTRGGDAGIDPALMEFIALTLPALAAGPRGVTYSAANLLPTEVTETWDASTGAVAVSMSVIRETSGYPARTVQKTRNVSNTPTPTYPTTYYPNITFTPPTPTAILSGGSDRIILFFNDGSMARTSNFRMTSASGGPTYELFTAAAIGLSGETPLHWLPQAMGSTPGGTIIGQSQLWRCADLSAGTPSFSSVFNFGTTRLYRNGDFSFGVGGPGLLGLVVSNNLYDTTWTVTTDGVTWAAEQTLSTGRQATTTPLMPGAFIDSRNGYLYATGFNGSNVYTLRQSTNNGSSFSALASISDDDKGMGVIDIPYADVSANKTVYHGWHDQNIAQTQGFYRAQLPSTAGTNIAPDVSGTRFGPDHVIGRGAFKTHSANKEIGLLCGINGARTASGVWRTTALSTVANGTWTPVIAPTGLTNYRQGAFADADITGDSFYLWGDNGAIGWCEDGETVDDRRGNISTAARVVGIAGW